MKLQTFLCLSLVALGGMTQAQDNPKAVERFGLWSQAIIQAEPAIEAVLMLTEQQVAQLKTARSETIDDVKTKALCDELRKKSMDKGVPAGERKAATEQRKEIVGKARKEWNSRIGAIFTPGQKNMVESLNSAAAFIIGNVNSGYSEKLKTAAGDARKALMMERDEKAGKAIRDRVNEILTDGQKAALAQAKAR